MLRLFSKIHKYVILKKIICYFVHFKFIGNCSIVITYSFLINTLIFIGQVFSKSQ